MLSSPLGLFQCKTTYWKKNNYMHFTYIQCILGHTAHCNLSCNCERWGDNVRLLLRRGAAAEGNGGLCRGYELSLREMWGLCSGYELPWGTQMWGFCRKYELPLRAMQGHCMGYKLSLRDMWGLCRGYEVSLRKMWGHCREYELPPRKMQGHCIGYELPRREMRGLCRGYELPLRAMQGLCIKHQLLWEGKGQYGGPAEDTGFH
jgi:hypothetical protein